MIRCQAICDRGGIGIRARLRGVSDEGTGSSPVDRTLSAVQHPKGSCTALSFWCAADAGLAAMRAHAGMDVRHGGIMRGWLLAGCR